MRILHLDPDDMDNPLAGGGPVRTYEICRRLARRHEVTVLTPTFPGSTPEHERDGIRYLRLGRKVGDHGSSHHLTYLAALPRAVRRFPHDLLVEDFMPPCSVTWAPFFLPRPRARVASVQWFYARDYTAWLKLPFHWGEHVGLRMHRHFVVLSEQMQQLITRRRPGAVCRLLPNGVDPGLFEIEPTVGRELLFLGRLDVETKGIDLLLQALAQVPEAVRPTLLLAGNNQFPAVLAGWIERTGTGPWVRLLGPVDAAGRAEALRRCRAVVMPSRYETFGMVIAEAQAAAKVVVVWDSAPMNEVAGPACIRVPPHDVAAYAAAIGGLVALDDAALLERGLAARAHARRFDWDHIAAGQEAFYAEALEYRRGHADRSRRAA
jgi:glycosyltransferase involved in cell wall biosynthesis